MGAKFAFCANVYCMLTKDHLFSYNTSRYRALIAGQVRASGLISDVKSWHPMVSKPEQTWDLSFHAIITITHKREQGVSYFETGCDWFCQELRKGYLLGLVHLFTLRCLLCNSPSFHGNHMFQQESMDWSQGPEGLMGVRHFHTINHSSAREMDSCRCVKFKTK